jgi:hypothetical protein
MIIAEFADCGTAELIFWSLCDSRSYAVPQFRNRENN